MDLIFKIAWRNIQRHRGKSLVVGIILFLGATVMTIGNGVVSAMEKGLRENIMNRFTGQIVVMSDKQEHDNVIFTPLGKDVQVITGFEEVKKVLASQDYIARFLPVGKGLTLILNDNGDVGYALVLGVRFEDYQKMFMNNVKLVEGRFLKNDDRGILVSAGSRKRQYDEQDFWLQPEEVPLNDKNLTPEALANKKNLDVRNSIIMMGTSSENTTMDIKLDVTGIIMYSYMNEFWKNFNIMDLESFREVFNYVTASDVVAKVPKEKQKLLERDNFDSLFGESVVENVDTGSKHYDVSKLIGKKVIRKKAEVDSGAYNLIFVKLKDINAINKSVEKLNRAFKANGANVRAVSWKKAVGQLADMAMIMRGATIGFVMLIFFVAIIIIMNTLSMAALERVSEIGMMRAVGAQKSFIAGMFFAETTIISFVSGGAGIIAGAIIVAILNALNITSENHILQLLFGGDVFKPSLDAVDILIGVAELSLVTVLAVVYPLKVARKITPLDAIMRD